jgi:hypothetical protein
MTGVAELAGAIGLLIPHLTFWRLYSANILRGQDLAGRGGRSGEFRTGCGSGIEAEYHRPFGDASHRPYAAR